MVNEHPNTRRLIAGLVAAAVFLAAFYLLTRIDRPAPIPETPVIVGPWSAEGLLYVTDTGGASNVWVASQGGVSEKLTQNESASTTLSGPVWSPDGSAIAFAQWSGIAKDAMPTGVMLMRPDGSDLRQISPGPGGDPIWSPDGSRLAFLSGAPRMRSSLAVVNVDGSGYQTLARRSWVYTHEEGLAIAAWSPDGTALAYVAGSSKASAVTRTILLTRFDGAKPTMLARVTRSGPIHDLSWSPDGSHLAFSCLCGWWELPRVYVMEVSGGPPVPVGAGWAPAWSPDGSRLAFVGRRPAGVGFAFHLSLVSIRTLERVRSFESERIAAVYPTIAWSPDGLSIAFTARHSDGLRIVVVQSNLSHGHRLATDGDAWLDNVPGGYVPEPA